MIPFRDQQLDPRFAELDAMIGAGKGGVGPVVKLPRSSRPTVRVHSVRNLTARETEMLLWMLTESSTKEIATEMLLTAGSAKVVMSKILQKCECHSRIQLIVRAYQGDARILWLLPIENVAQLCARTVLKTA